MAPYIYGGRLARGFREGTYANTVQTRTYTNIIVIIAM